MPKTFFFTTGFKDIDVTIKDTYCSKEEQIEQARSLIAKYYPDTPILHVNEVRRAMISLLKLSRKRYVPPPFDPVKYVMERLRVKTI